jgi:NF-kappa-B-activating protein
MQQEFLVSFKILSFFTSIHFHSFSSLDPSHPAGKRREIDNVMKKARQQPANEYWDKKLLEVEDKEPGRWKHSGYAKIYNVNSGNGSRRSRSRSPVRRTPVSPQRSRHPQPTRGCSPERYRPRSPPPHYSSRERMMKTKEIVRPTKGRPISPPIHHKVRRRMSKFPQFFLT